MTDIRIAGSDAVTETFTIETDAGVHVVTLDGPGVPESVRLLLQYLRARAQNLPESP